MLSRKMLEEMGLEKEQIEKIMEAHGKGVEKYKSDVSIKDEEIKRLEKQLKDANDQIAEFGDIEEIQQQVKEYKEKFEQMQKEREEIEYNYKLKEELKKFNPHDVNDLLLYINKDDIVYKDGKFYNLDKEVEDIKETKPYLFKSEKKEKKPRFSGPTGEVDSTEITKEEFKNMSYFDRVKLKKENENLYNKLMKGE